MPLEKAEVDSVDGYASIEALGDGLEGKDRLAGLVLPRLGYGLTAHG